MNCYFFFKKNLPDTLIEQTKSKPYETLEFVLNKQRKTFSSNHPMNLALNLVNV